MRLSRSLPSTTRVATSTATRGHTGDRDSRVCAHADAPICTRTGALRGQGLLTTGRVFNSNILNDKMCVRTGTWKQDLGVAGVPSVGSPPLVRLESSSSPKLAPITNAVSVRKGLTKADSRETQVPPTPRQPPLTPPTVLPRTPANPPYLPRDPPPRSPPTRAHSSSPEGPSRVGPPEGAASVSRLSARVRGLAEQVGDVLLDDILKSVFQLGSILLITFSTVSYLAYEGLDLRKPSWITTARKRKNATPRRFQ
ncbi:uncharacterized protein [Macaca nemestrina]|uniref:uncharacterized protein n=1 Tax=Macaca nemestrina TaxID=9545 RepID=UPI0039B93B75